MKKLFILLILAVTLTAGVAGAEGFKIDVTEINTTVNPAKRQEARFHVDITNTGDQNRTFRINYDRALFPSWYFIDRPALQIAPGQIRRSTLYVTPDRQAVAGSYAANIIVRPSDQRNDTATYEASVHVTRDINILISEFQGPQPEYAPDQPLDVSITVKNVVQSDLPSNQYQLVLNLDSEQITHPIPALDAGETEQITASMDLTGYTAGIYDLQAVLQEIDGTVHSTQTARIKVTELKQIDRHTEADLGILESTYTVSATNNGNTIERNINVTAESPWYLSPFIDFKDQPDKIIREDGQETFIWTIGSISPGETVSFTYDTDYWILLAVLLIIITGLYILYSHFRTVAIVKSAKKSAGHLSVHLRVKNNSGKMITDVEIDDFVPGIAKLIEKFDSRSPDQIQPTDEGTKLVWELEEMQPGEERIITYKLKPRVKVEGHIALPPAVVEYFQAGREKVENSHPVTADFR